MALYKRAGPWNRSFWSRRRRHFLQRLIKRLFVFGQVELARGVDELLALGSCVGLHVFGFHNTSKARECI